MANPTYGYPNYTGYNFPTYMPPSPAPMQPNQGISSASRMVGSKEEAVAIPTDLSGAFMVFPDVSHNRVYVKRLNPATGGSDLFEFMPATAQVEAQYVTVDDFKAFKEEVAKRLARKGKKDDDASSE